MSETPKKDNPGTFVSIDLCISRHESLAKEMGAMNAELKTIKEALVGADLQGGLVKKFNEMNGKLKMGSTAIDWIKPVVIAVVSTGATLVLFKVLSLF